MIDKHVSERLALTDRLPEPEHGHCDVLIIAGEHSGDHHAAAMVREAFAVQPNLRICALGGEALRLSGAQLLYELTSASVVGVVEVLKHYGFFKRLFEQTIEWVEQHRPKLICFVDYPGFNLRLAKRLVREGLAHKGGGSSTLMYYISPQVWAWKKRRRFAMAEHLDALGVIFPFEVKVFADTSLLTQFVGHPFAKPNAEKPFVYAANSPALLLPGSRAQAVKRILPVLLKGWSAYAETRSSAKATIIYPDERILNIIQDVLSHSPEALRKRIELRTLTPGSPIPASAALMSSGTMSLQVALCGIPGAIVYRAHPITYALGRMLVTVPYLGMANLLLKEAAWPEYIQNAATPLALSRRLIACQENPQHTRLATQNARTLKTLLSAETGLSAGAWLLQGIDAFSRNSTSVKG